MKHKPNHQLSPELEQYLALCKRIYERMERESSWPWADDWKEAPDSPDWQKMIESRRNSKNI